MDPLDLLGLLDPVHDVDPSVGDARARVAVAERDPPPGYELIGKLGDNAVFPPDPVPMGTTPLGPVLGSLGGECWRQRGEDQDKDLGGRHFNSQQGGEENRLELTAFLVPDDRGS